MSAILTTIEGRPVQLVTRQTGLPPRLDALLAGLRTVDRRQVIVTGWSRDCGEDNHRFALWLHGFYGPRELNVSICLSCETAEVRDISLDLLTGLRTGLRGPLRRNDLLGWYTGKRRAGRIYS